MNIQERSEPSVYQIPPPVVSSVAIYAFFLPFHVAKKSYFLASFVVTSAVA